MNLELFFRVMLSLVELGSYNNTNGVWLTQPNLQRYSEIHRLKRYIIYKLAFLLPLQYNTSAGLDLLSSFYFILVHFQVYYVIRNKTVLTY